MDKDKRFSPVNFAFLAAGAFFLVFSGGKFNFWLAAWFPAVFFIRFLRNSKTVSGYFFIVLVAWVTTSITWYGIQPAGGLFHLINMLIASLITALPFLLDKIIYRKLPAFARTLVYPLFATALEYMFISGNPMGSFGSLAYTQYNNLAFIQIISITGMMSLTFVISWFASVLNEVWEAEWKFKNVRAISVAFLLTLCFVYSYGGLRLIKANSDASANTVSVSMIVRSNGNTSLPDIMSKTGQERFEFADQVFENFVENTNWETGSEIVSWPEGAVVVRESGFSEKDSVLKQLSRDKSVYLLVPFIVIPEDGRYSNLVILYTPEGKTAFTHVKYGGNLFECSTPGDGLLKYADTRQSRISALICWDMDFPTPVLQAGRNNVDILFSPSSEWKAITPVHAQMSVYRGIENGFSTVHPASLGYSVIADPYGKEIASMNWFSSTDTTIRAQVNAKGVRTIYAVIGDVFPLTVLASIAILLVYLVIRKIMNRTDNKQKHTTI